VGTDTDVDYEVEFLRRSRLTVWNRALGGQLRQPRARVRVIHGEDICMGWEVKNGKSKVNSLRSSLQAFRPTGETVPIDKGAGWRSIGEVGMRAPTKSGRRKLRSPDGSGQARSGCAMELLRRDFIAWMGVG
jgi:hypothetical protein